jgi:hemerythrin superfamily protein
MGYDDTLPDDHDIPDGRAHRLPGGIVDAVALLIEQHQEVTALFEKYEGEEDAAARRQLFIEVADALSAHSAIEETLFYPGVNVPGTAELLRRSADEHLDVKRLIADLLDRDPQDARFDAGMTALQRAVAEHVEEEESELFPRVKAALTQQALQTLGDQMQASFDELSEEEPRNDVRAQLERASGID